jgi:hypothetical protein
LIVDKKYLPPKMLKQILIVIIFMQQKYHSLIDNV